eukprot:scaffold539_cov359-Prasinococcus_capsulatus_cf.AAC.30
MLECDFLVSYAVLRPRPGDFGVSSFAAGSGARATTARCGTPLFTAPEAIHVRQAPRDQLVACRPTTTSRSFPSIILMQLPPLRGPCADGPACVGTLRCQDSNFNGQAADMWALGVSAYLLLTGIAPFGIDIDHDAMTVSAAPPSEGMRILCAGPGMQPQVYTAMAMASSKRQAIPRAGHVRQDPRRPAAAALRRGSADSSSH